jgi:hypothetical protein
MGFRFRKSVKIAPGVKLNFGKKSVGMSIGGKYGGVSFNSKTGARVRASAPGTGLSYSTKISGSGKKCAKSSSKPVTNSRPICLRWWYIALIVLFAIGGLGNIGTSIGAAIFGIAVAAIMGLFTLKAAKPAPSNGNSAEKDTTSEQTQE